MIAGGELIDDLVILLWWFLPMAVMYRYSEDGAMATSLLAINVGLLALLYLLFRVGQ